MSRIADGISGYWHQLTDSCERMTLLLKAVLIKNFSKMIQTRKLRTLCVKKDLAQNTLKSMLAKSSPLTNLLSKFDNFKKAVFVSRLCVSSPPCCLALLKLLTQSHFPLEVLGLEKNDKMRHQSCCSLSSRKYREWFSRRVLSWVTEKQEAKPVKWGVTPRLLRRVTLRLVVHVTGPTTLAVIPAPSLSFTFSTSNLLPRLIATGHALWQPPVAPPGDFCSQSLLKNPGYSRHGSWSPITVTVPRVRPLTTQSTRPSLTHSLRNVAAR